MTFAEFLVEFTKAYSQVVTALAWPMVALIVFFVCLHKLGQFRGGARKRSLLSTRTIENLLSRMETQCNVQGRLSKCDRNRLALLRRHIDSARAALLDEDEKRITQAFSALSSLAACGDRHIPELDPNGENPYDHPELLLPEKQTSKR